jgi:hypothetical protein
VAAYRLLHAKLLDHQSPPVQQVPPPLPLYPPQERPLLFSPPGMLVLMLGCSLGWFGVVCVCVCVCV